MEENSRNNHSDDNSPEQKRPKRQRSSNSTTYAAQIRIKREVRARFQKVKEILAKKHDDRTEDEKLILSHSNDVLEEMARREEGKRTRNSKTVEHEDDPETLEDKCRNLSEIIRTAKQLVVYTGAGISTAASIPDYRGPQGVWTLLRKGKQVKTGDLVEAEPTFTHMSIVKLHQMNLVQYVVSQNCDGLHLRSGLPREHLSEIHGNMYIEVCPSCSLEYVRLFDVTEQTAFRRHATGRRCHQCGEVLRDSIVHFGEKGDLGPPHNWPQAAEQARKADVVVCLGSSLKVLRKYRCLWCMERPAARRPKLCIVNLQWTPKDESAFLKIHGRCDQVMALVMKELQLTVPAYCKSQDPILRLATPLFEFEGQTSNKHVDGVIPKLEPATEDESHDANVHRCRCVADDMTWREETRQDVSEKEGPTPSWFGKGMCARKKRTR